jgi:general secretion pathway protein D
MALNLQDADVRAAIDVVLGEALKVPYTVSPQVQGRVTLNTGRALSGDELLAALEAALAGVSAALVVNGSQYEVLPLDAVPQRVRQAYVQRRGERSMPGYAVQFVPLRNAAAADVQKLLEVIAPKGVVLQSDPARNRVVIAGSGTDRATLARTIEELDTDSMQGMSVGLFRLQHVGAEQVLGEIRQIFKSSGDFADGRLRLIPMDRIRTVVGIAPRRADLERIESWIRRLDVAPPAAERRLYVIAVQHSRARELADTLQLVLTGEASPFATGAAGAFGTGDPGQRPLSGMPSPTLGQAVAPAGVAQGAFVPGMPFPGGLVPGATFPGVAFPGAAVPGAQAGSAAARAASLRIVANDDNNSLVLYGTEAEHRLVRDAMLQLDQPARQVLIEAVIAEVTLGDDLRFGVQWFFDSNGSQATFTNRPDGSVLSQFPGFSYFRALSTDARLVINALQSKTDVNVLSAPRLSVLNNRRAQLMVGDEVPILSQVSQSSFAPGAPLVSSITMRDTGVMLEVVPRIGENGSVVLEVTQEVSDVAVTTTSGIDSPTIQRRRLRSMIATRDGATVALGGLIRETQSQTRSGLPLLKDLPWLGALFRTDSVNTKRTELVILLVPRLMRNDEDNRQALEDFMSGFKASADLMRDGIRAPLQLGN